MSIFNNKEILKVGFADAITIEMNEKLQHVKKLDQYVITLVLILLSCM